MEQNMEKEISRQQANEIIIRNNVYCCQSTLVSDMLAKEIFSYDDIINLCRQTCPECGSDYNDNIEECPDCKCKLESEPQEIFEWWIVNDWLAEKLKEIGEPILENDYGIWWGRCCTGQSLCLDSTFDKIRELIK